tara:strand:- start:3938 stop:4285 length:348 start_codon:yes stop_codon:yes gene_type:complete
MVKASWGTKRTCNCGIRFYDLNKKEIECPSCGEMINVEILSVSNIENNLRKKTQVEVASGVAEKEKNIIPEEDKKEGKTDSTDDVIEKGDEVDKVEVEEIIGDKITEDKDKKSDE